MIRQTVHEKLRIAPCRHDGQYLYITSVAYIQGFHSSYGSLLNLLRNCLHIPLCSQCTVALFMHCSVCSVRRCIVGVICVGWHVTYAEEYAYICRADLELCSSSLLVYLPGCLGSLSSLGAPSYLDNQQPVSVCSICVGRKRLV